MKFPYISQYNADQYSAFQNHASFNWMLRNLEPFTKEIFLTYMQLLLDFTTYETIFTQKYGYHD
jgi:hypothetical protein